jgi:hypothetical protein
MAAETILDIFNFKCSEKLRLIRCTLRGIMLFSSKSKELEEELEALQVTNRRQLGRVPTSFPFISSFLHFNGGSSYNLDLVGLGFVMTRKEVKSKKNGRSNITMANHFINKF